MGNYVGRAMEDNLKKNQEFMLEMNRYGRMGNVVRLDFENFT